MSKSATYQSRKSGLEQKEKLLLSDMNEKSDKVKQVVKWSLIAGLIALLGFGLYRSFSNPSTKTKKKKKGKAKESLLSRDDENKVMDSLITYGSPILGNWLLRNLKDSDSADKD
jgi:hypothetical protein